MEPTIVYKKGGPHRGPKGITFSYKGVSDSAEHKKLLADGWSDDLEVACGLRKAKTKAKKPQAPKEVTPDEQLD